MWAIFAIIVSIINACYYIGNQNSRLKPSLFMVYRGFFPVLAVLPFLFFYIPDFEWQYYILVVLQGLAISYMDLSYFKSFQQFGAEMVASIRPLTVGLTFLIWMIIKPSLMDYYLDSPIKFAIILFAIAVMIYSIMKYRQQKIAYRCLYAVLPLLLISAFVDVSNKLILYYVHGHLFSAALWRVFITGNIIGLINLYVCRRYNIKKRDVFKLKNLRKGLFILLLPLSMITVNFSLYYAQNPAYTSAIIYLSIIWVMYISKFTKILKSKKNYRHIEKKWILSILIAAIVLIIATN